MAEHHVNCLEIRRTPLGHTERGRSFIEKYGLVIHFDIECLGCCFGYLTTERQYSEARGPNECVYFTDGNAANVLCFVNVPGGGRHGQISTDMDRNMGTATRRRPFENSRTYQLYGENANLCMGRVLIARMESLAIDEATLGDLSSAYVSYTDAALIELYRNSRDRPLPSLRGFCNLTAVHAIDIENLNLDA